MKLTSDTLALAGLIVGLGGYLTALMRLEIKRLEAGIVAVKELTEAKFDAVDRRFMSLESDMTLVKQHIVNHPAA